MKGSYISIYVSLGCYIKFQKTKQPNAPVIFGCYKNAMSSNVNYAIKVAQITTLEEVMRKATEMEGNMLESCHLCKWFD
jgi:hypothetical protein